MDDRTLVTRLITIGVEARRKNVDAYATPSDYPDLLELSAATVATWLEELGRLISDN